MGRKPMLSRGSAFASTPTFPPGACSRQGVKSVAGSGLQRGPEPTAPGQTFRAERSAFVETVFKSQIRTRVRNAPPALPIPFAAEER